MTKINRWLLPEGIEEILPPKAMQMEHLCRELIDLLASWGYEFVIPPMLEYLESLLTGTGEDLDLKTFKLTDQISGRLMGIRADMTPQVARIDAHIMKQNVPTRLCYLGHVLHTRPEKSGDTRAPLQIGAELYGHSGSASDIEIVQLMLATLRHAGIDKPYLDLGHIGIFRDLSRASNCNAEQLAVIFEMLQRKAKDELKSYYNEQAINNEACLAMYDLIDMNGDIKTLAEAEKRFISISENVSSYLQEMKMLCESLQDKKDVDIHIDLAELRGYHYHTGMVYTAYVSGRGEGIAFGGRYDDIGSAFGRARPATGFSTDIKSLVKFASKSQTLDKIFAPAGRDSSLLNKINELRESGKIVIQQLEGQTASAEEMDCEQYLQQENDQWVIKKIKK
ncbi:MAG: ATP phosphoribosyltransferase regulatory subunit [Pseudomonadota bacterium]